MTTATAQPERVTFASTSAAHRIVLRPPRPIFAPSGDQIGFDPGKTLQFVNGRLETSDPDDIAWLRANRGSGLLELTADEAGQPGPVQGVEIVDGSSTSNRIKAQRSYRCDFCGQAFADPLAKGRHVSQTHKAEVADRKKAAAGA
jgi:hypothetical protein